MANVSQALNTFEQMGHVRVAAASNQAGTFANGLNGVGATFTYATGALVIDGVTLAVNDRVLFLAQTLGYINGIWQVVQAGATGVSAILQRAPDMQSIEQIRGGHYVFVQAGTALAGSAYVIIEPLPAALGVPSVAGANNIVFGSMAAAAGLGTLGAQNSNAVSITGGSISGLTPPLPVASGGTGAATAPLALTGLGVKRGTTAAFAGGSTSNAFTATGIAAADLVTASILTSTNSVSITKITPTLNTITAVFSADPGANTVLVWHALPA